MKRTPMLAALAAFSILAGCDSSTPQLLSVEPVAGAEDTTIDASLLGTWQEQGEQDLMAIVRPADKGGYQITVISGTTAISLQAKLFTVKDAEFLDVMPDDGNDFRIPAHAVMRIWNSGAILRWAFLDSDWLKQKAAALPSHAADGKMQLFAPSADVRAFLTQYGTDDRAAGQAASWQRVQ